MITIPATATREILLLDNASGGSADVKINDGMTLGQLFHQNHPTADLNGYTRMVNNVEQKDTYALQQDDVVAFVPGKVEGATL